MSSSNPSKNSPSQSNMEVPRSASRKHRSPSSSPSVSRTQTPSISRQSKKNKTRNTILVASRFRPQLPAEIASGGENIVTYHPNQKTVSLKHPKDRRSSSFTFDKVFPEHASQEEVFQFCGVPAVDDLFNGLSGVIFAYGQTGAGKTWSVFGNLGSNSGLPGLNRRNRNKRQNGRSKASVNNGMGSPMSPTSTRRTERFIDDDLSVNSGMGSPTTPSGAAPVSDFGSAISVATPVDNRGLGPRIVARIFDRIAAITRDKSINSRFSVKISFYEIYMEKVLDLLSKDNYTSNGPPHFGSAGISDHLHVKEDLNSGGFYVSGLTEIYCHSVTEVMKYIKIGNQRKKKATTSMNRDSSRSHTILSLTLTRHEYDTDTTLESTLNIVDLAGSERIHRSHASGERLKEATAINKSLAALGKVLFLLTQKKKSSHIPFRESKLTKLLSEALQGRARTTLLINCSPSSINVSEILSTLRFGVSAKSIKTRNALKPPTRNTNLAHLKKKLKHSETKISDMEDLCRTLEADLQTAQQTGTFRLKKLKSVNNMLLQEIYSRRQQVLDVEEELADCRFDLQTMEFREVQVSQEYEMKISQLTREVEIYQDRCKDLERYSRQEHARLKYTRRGSLPQQRLRSSSVPARKHAMEADQEEESKSLDPQALLRVIRELSFNIKSIRFDYDLLKLEYQRLRDDQETMFQEMQEQISSSYEQHQDALNAKAASEDELATPLPPLLKAPHRKTSSVSLTHMSNLEKENTRLRKGIEHILQKETGLSDQVSQQLRELLAGAASSSSLSSHHRYNSVQQGGRSPTNMSPLSNAPDTPVLSYDQDYERNLSNFTAETEDNDTDSRRIFEASAQCGTVQMLHLESEDSDPEWKSRWLVLDVEKLKLKCYKNMKSIVPKEITLSDVEEIIPLPLEDLITLRLNNKTEWSFKVPNQNFEEWKSNIVTSHRYIQERSKVASGNDDE